MLPVLLLQRMLGAEERGFAGGLELSVEARDAIDLAVTHHVALAGKHLAGGTGSPMLEGLRDAVAAKGNSGCGEGHKKAHEGELPRQVLLDRQQDAEARPR
jgi:hypothetical protein